MHRMKRHIVLPAAALILGAAGCAVRLWERRCAYDSVSGLTEMSSPAVAVLLILTAAAVVAAFVLARAEFRDFPGGYDDAFYAPNAGYPTLLILAAVAAFAAGGLAYLHYREDVALFSVGALQAKPSPLPILLTVMAVVSGLCLFPVARNGYRGKGKGRRFAPLLAPAFLCCVWLVVCYLEEAANPDMMSYVFGRMAAIADALALYYIASFSFEKPKPRRAVFFCVAGIFFSFVSLGDSGALYLRVMSLFALLTLTAQLCALSWNNTGGHLPKTNNTSEVTTDEP